MPYPEEEPDTDELKFGLKMSIITCLLSTIGTCGIFATLDDVESPLKKIALIVAVLVLAVLAISTCSLAFDIYDDLED